MILLCIYLLGNQVFAQESPDHHAESDAYWARLAQSYPEFQINLEDIRVPAANELNALGEWGPVLDWPHIPVSAAHLPDGRILTWASNEEDGFPGGAAEFTYAAAWDPADESFKMVPHTSHDMFCAHQVMLEDGRLFVMGGRNTVNLTSIYDPTTDTWEQQEPMANGRWYPTAVGIPNGDVMIAVGSGGGSFPEVWNDNSGWRTLTGVNLNAPILDYTSYYENNWWPLLHVAPDGDVFHSGPTPDMHRINTAGTGSIVKTGPQITDWYPKHGATVMYDEGKLLVAGGAIAGGNLASSNRALTIDINGSTPIVTEVASMFHARKFQNGVMLPTGEVLVVGGNTSGTKFSDNGTVLAAEMWDPQTELWTELSDMSVPRNYHSVALLMTDGRVWVGGGGLCGTGCAANHMDAQIYSPPYLYNGDGSLASRPEITSAPASIRNGATASISATAGLATFSMIKMSSTTHGVNSDVRYLTVPFTENGAGSYDLDMHNNMNVLTPGYWMLFGIDASGVPSEAAVIQVSTEGVPQVTNPGTQVTPEGDVVSLFIDATDDGSLTFSASGLPSNLSINSSTGEISGVIAEGSAGSYEVDVSVSDALGGVDVSFTWVVTTGATGQILREWWTGISGNEINLLTDDPDYPDNPDGSDFLTSFEAPADWADNYGTRIRGYIYPPLTGDYTFWIATDDFGELWLSTDENPANVSRIANVPGWANDYDWSKYPEQQSASISLQAGERYYVEVLQKEGGGLDNIAVAWQIPGGSQEVIDGGFLSPYSGTPVIINPGDQADFEGATVAWNVSASDPEGDAISFSATGLPSGITINGDGLVSGTIADGSVGDHEVIVSVTDGNTEATVLFTWTVLAPAEAQGEVGVASVDQSGSSQWHTVNLENEYLYPVVIMGPPSYAGTDPLSVRVRNVTSNSFEFQLDEWDYLDGVHGTESVGYLVIESGVHVLNDGRTIQAGIADINNNFTFVNYHEAFSSNPVVFSQVGSVNEGSAATTRQRNVSGVSFEVQVEEEENNDATHANETVYWVAVDIGTNAEGLANESASTGDVVEEFFHAINFTQSYSSTPVFIANMQSTDGGDTATLRHQNLSGSGVEVMVEEEASGDDEVGHTLETVGYLVFDAAGQITFEGYEPPPIVLANPGEQSGEEGEAAVLSIDIEQDNGQPITFSASGLPAGLTINSSSGLISGGLLDDGSTMVTVTADDGISTGSVSFNWTVNAARGTWIDFADDTNTLSIADDSEEKDLATGDLNKDGFTDIVVVRKEGFMASGARSDLLIMNENGILVDRTADLAPGFDASPTIARDVMIIDLDGDGWDDVLIANTFGDQPRFYRNLGESAGTWLGLADESVARLPTLDTNSIQYCAVAAGDITGDGAPDLYFSNYVMDGTTKDVLLVNDGNGNFSDEGDSRLGSLIDVAFGTQATIIDIDHDGDEDIVKLSANQPAGPFSSDGVFILYNDGSGNFADHSTVPTTEAYMYLIGDFDNNNEYDFYIVDDGADYVNLSSGVTANTNISFTQQTTNWVRTAGHGANLRAGDLDHDGDLDMGVADVDTSEPPCEATDLRAFLLLENEGSATGNFIDPFGAADKPWSQNLYDFAFVDINNDGNLDIFTAGCSGYGLFTSTQDPIDPPAETVVIPLGDLNNGIAAHDPRTGSGYIMYSEESIHTRFASTPPSAWNADHLIAVVFDNGQWKIDRNKNQLVAFIPQSSDRLVAEVDFGANTVNHLEGTDSVIEGITAGYVSGDLVITPEMWDGAPNAGEFGVEGTEIVVEGVAGNTPPELVAIGNQENSVDELISLSLSATDSDGDAVSFSETGLPAGLTLSGSEITGTLTTAGVYTVTITADDGNGGTDKETFTWTVDGGDPGTTVTVALGDLNNGIAAHDQRVGGGYIMYSEESIHTRFADNPPSAWNADHLIAVVFDGGEWKIDRNKYTLVPFIPRSTDQLVAEVDFGADIVTHLVGINTVIEGIAAGYVSGDLVITAEMWAGSPNEGEFGVEGTSIEIAADVVGAERRLDELVGAKTVPDTFSLSSIYPNPFTASTTIAYELAEDVEVDITVYTITGQRVRVLMEGHRMPAGRWQSLFDGRDDGGRPLAAGVYMVRFRAGEYLKIGKVVLVK